jgi:cellulose synthase/poly-beta-1,6-N-acetylglucosamine synthase-like glycosyltransferase
MQVQGAVSLLAWLPVAGLALMLLKLELELGRAPRLQPLAPCPEPVSPVPLHLRVVIPAYNEADNIADCISAALASRDPGVPWQLVVIDDASSDTTHALAREALGPDTPERLLLQAGPRPVGERWCGKNWAASLAAACLLYTSDAADDVYQG